MSQQTLNYKTIEPNQVKTWYEACKEEQFPSDGGLCVEFEGLQIAIFNFSRRKKWYATQNLCPHKKQMILSRGMLGSEGEEPKVACPFHKKTFSLESGANLNGHECALATYPIKVEEGVVYVGLG